MNLLEVRNLTKKFGGVIAVNNVSFSLKKGEIYGLIGPNGAGKTTLFNCIAGHFPCTEGIIHFTSKDITKKPAHHIFRLGISRTFQLVKIFGEMSVLENVMVAALSHTNSTHTAKDEALKILDFIGLCGFVDTLGKNLTLVNRKFLDLASALASEPKLLMLDELFAGLTPTEVQQALQLIFKLVEERNITVVLIEHVMEVIMPVCHRVMVLDNGCKITEGEPKEIVNNPDVIKAYLGDKYHAEHQKRECSLQ